LTAVLKKGRELPPDQWDAFVWESPQGNLYHCHAYLSHLLPDWEAAVIYHDGQIAAAWPWEQKRRWGIAYVLQPPFAQYHGVLFRSLSDQPYKALEFQKKALQLLHAAIPPAVRYMSVTFSPAFAYDLPLIWSGWQQRTCYTYWTDIGMGYEAFLGSVASHVRREIKKAAQAHLRVAVENAPEQVVAILKKAKPEVVQTISPRFFEGLCQNARHYYAEGQSCCLIGYDGSLPIAGIIYFFYKDTMIYYQGSTLPEYKNSGIMSAIIAESVRLYGHQYRYLDFDGSMIEPIERFFRGFAAFPVRYSRFTLDRLPLPVSWLQGAYLRLRGWFASRRNGGGVFRAAP
jgi:hypothetical protein